jgi:hypothetical protein
VAFGVLEHAGRDIFRGVPLLSKTGAEPFLALETDPVRTKPYPHDSPSIGIHGLTCNEHATQGIAVGRAKSLTAKHMRRLLRRVSFQEIFLCHDLDVTVKSSPRITDWPKPLSHARGLRRSFPLKTDGWRKFAKRF